MSKHTVYTSVTPVPPGVSRATVLQALHDHASMIDLNPLVIERHPCKAPGKASPEEYSAIWYSITDRVSYLPGGMVSGQITYYACFHDLPDGLQTHCYAPLGVDIRERWSVGGNEPGEPRQVPPMGIGAPKDGLYLREDIDMRCNIMTTSFVKKNLKNAHKTLVERLVEMSQLHENKVYNERLVAGGPVNSQNTASPSSSYRESFSQPSPTSLSPIAPRYAQPQQQQQQPQQQYQHQQPQHQQPQHQQPQHQQPQHQQPQHQQPQHQQHQQYQQPVQTQQQYNYSQQGYQPAYHGVTELPTTVTESGKALPELPSTHPAPPPYNQPNQTQHHQYTGNTNVYSKQGENPYPDTAELPG